MNPATADAALFADALACDEHRPAAFVPGGLDGIALHALCARAEAFLQAVAVVEDSRADEPDEHSPTALALRRVEARLDLLTVLVASLARREGGDPSRSLRWSATGARLHDAGAFEPGTAGQFRIQPCDWLPEALVLPARVAAADAGSRTLWLHFDRLTPGLTQALERHLFRVHRREIAGRRQRG